MSKKIIGLNTKTLEEKEFESIEEAQELVGNKGTVKRCLDNKIKSTKGWLFKYEGEDFTSKAKEITDKRIKVYILKKEGKEIGLPMEMIQNLYGISKSELVTASKGISDRNQDVTTPRYTTKGFTVREATDKEKEEILNNTSYIDYIKSKNNKVTNDKPLSIGEGFIKNILEFNDINFIREKYIEDTQLRMDFYIEKEGQKFCIEYMGQQHYRERNGVTSLSYRLKNDRIKKKYCAENGIIFIEVSYDYTIQTIIKLLNLYLGNIESPTVFTFYNNISMDIDDFVKNYQYKDKYQMSEYYNITLSDVSNIATLIGKNLKREFVK
ncbi:intron encoded nuclease [Staphylococcus phage phiSA12]|uniref:Putative intron-encoded nuclease n=1 Tax=Staphylococcus phage phiSA12 TaxID=1450142 RepID=W0TVW7_9CAUD|nr:intron encoded nuclease [Staphylococcus phage phiSA12]BAO47128.1 putative intron-encoded nuclease [Staphylococcus phage phiSA12]